MLKNTNNGNGYHVETHTVTANTIPVEKRTPREFVQKYLHYLPLFLFSLVFFSGLTYLYLRYKIPVYNSNVKILVKDDDKSSSSDADELSSEILSRLISNGKTNISNELEIIKSNTLMQKVVSNLGLNVVLSSLGNLRETELYDIAEKKLIKFTSVRDSSLHYEVVLQIINHKIWYITDMGKIQVSNNGIVKTKNFDFSVHINNFNDFKPDYSYKAKWYSPEWMAKKLAAEIAANSLNKEASIMLISYSSTVPSKGRDLLNALAAEYSKANIDEKNRTVDNTIQFVNDRLVLISGELGGVEKDLQHFREKNNVIDVAGQQQFEIDRLKEIKDKLDDADVKLRVVEMVSNYVNDPARKFSLVPSSLGIEDETLLGLVQEYNKGVIQREDLLKTVAPKNIAVVTLEDRLDQMRLKIIETTGNIKKSFQSAYNLTKGEYDNILHTMNSIPGKEKQLLEITRQQGIKEKLYLFLLQKREEAAITRASSVSNSTPIDPAITNPIPVEPNKTLLYLMAFATAIGVPLLIIYLRDIFNDKITTRVDILEYTQAQVIGEINHHTADDGSRKIIANKSRSILSEQFRIIRTNLQYFLLVGESASTILVTSTMANEGKTFISMNLGAVLALAGKRVLLLEFDLRKPKITSSLNIDSGSQGITTYLTGKMQVNNLIKPIPGVDNYFLLPSGPIPPNPAELLLTPRLDELFKELKESFDYIIIDCPPVGIVSDAKVLSRFSNINFYIIRQRYTLKKQLQFINEFYIEQKMKNMALIVNDIKMTGANGYHGYANTYGYGYGYSRYNYDYSYGNGYGYGIKEKQNGNVWWNKLTSIIHKE